MDSCDGCVEQASTQDGTNQWDAVRKLAQFEAMAGDGSGPDLSETICFFFGLALSDFELYTTLLDHQRSTSRELAETLGNDRSLINKRLLTLREADLVNRETHPLSDGGYEYRYRAQPLPETVEELNDEIEAWSEEAVTRFQQITPSTPADGSP
ncbi:MULTISPECIES: helix-turn-helix domain-containing protein [Halococcus]|uniref:Transcriptional regulator, TrmB n=1 Tax=Halococcus saccharolyticus DSM 5350 TaxID=1227455 RepID=M0MCU8_9EURY|nr:MULTISPECIES: helix-turn-helix domain-containing protein [Halococcus]EMA43551.1 transcriptional regulator, TrmB [Halococcus saccharolyticus DSM 5350]